MEDFRNGTIFSHLHQLGEYADMTAGGGPQKTVTTPAFPAFDAFQKEYRSFVVKFFQQRDRRFHIRQDFNAHRDNIMPLRQSLEFGLVRKLLQQHHAAFLYRVFGSKKRAMEFVHGPFKIKKPWALEPPTACVFAIESSSIRHLQGSAGKPHGFNLPPPVEILGDLLFVTVFHDLRFLKVCLLITRFRFSCQGVYCRP